VKRKHAERALRRDAAKEKVAILSGLDAKLEEARVKAKKEEAEREAELNASPPHRFYFKVVTEISGRVWEYERAKLYALSPKEQDEYLKLKFIDRMNARPIRSCEVVEWGDYAEED
jgi:hypothetical protein